MPAVVARPIRHQRDQAAVGSPCEQQLVERLADRLHHLLVGALPMAPIAASPSGGASGGRDTRARLQAEGLQQSGSFSCCLDRRAHQLRLTNEPHQSECGDCAEQRLP